MRKAEPYFKFIRSRLFSLLAITSEIISAGGSIKIEHIKTQVLIKDTKCQYKVTLSPTIQQGEQVRAF